MIISPEISLHENVAVLDFNGEYANITTRHNISYENLSSDIVLTKEIETWRGFIDNLPSDEDKVVLTLVQQFLEIPLNSFLFILIQPDI